MAGAYPDAPWMPKCIRAKETLGNIGHDAALAYYRTMTSFRGDNKDLVRPEFRRLLGGYEPDALIRDCMNKAHRKGLNPFLYTDTKTYLVDDILTKVDRASMAVSLEVRVPLLDHTFVEFAHRIPFHMKIRKKQGKAIFKSSLRPYLDDETLYRGKHGFEPPMGNWMRGPLADMVNDLLFTRHPAYAEYLSLQSVATAWREHQARRRDHAGLLWLVLMYELWAREFLVVA
jgi:asparagine synthase (glutamine-hydrolysing)